MRAKEGISQRASTGKLAANGDAIRLEKGESRTVAVLSGPGRIAHIWFIASSQDIRYPRAVVLRIYWDGAAVPSVETPVGDFFGPATACGPRSTPCPSSPAPTAAATTATGRCPSAARPRSSSPTNRTRKRPGSTTRSTGSRLETAPDDLLYFHARYHQEYPPGWANPTPSSSARAAATTSARFCPRRTPSATGTARATTSSTSTARPMPDPGRHGHRGLLQRRLEHAGPLQPVHRLHHLRAAGHRRPGHRLPLAHRRPDHLRQVAALRDRAPRLRHGLQGCGHRQLQAPAGLLVLGRLLVPGRHRRAVVPLPALQGAGQRGSRPPSAEGDRRP